VIKREKEILKTLLFRAFFVIFDGTDFEPTVIDQDLVDGIKDTLKDYR
jgi:hypothetical protein